MRAVEGEVARLRLGHARAVVRAHVVLRHLDLFALRGHDDHRPAPQPCPRLDRVDEPRALVGSNHDPVDHHLDVVLLVLVERDLLAQLVQASINTPPPETRLRAVLDQRPVLALATLDHRPEHHHARAFRQLLDVVRHLLHRLPPHLAAAHRAVRKTDARIEQAQVVVDLGHRAHGRARVLRRALLVDRDRRREPLDDVDVGLLHLAQELPGVCRQRLDVTPLAFCIDGVEGERRFARPRQAGEHDQLVAWDRQRHVLEVVLARAPNRYLVGWHRTLGYSLSRPIANVALAVATSRPSWPITEHSATAVRRPEWITCPVARSVSPTFA